MNILEKLKAKNHILPSCSQPAAAYQMASQVGNIVYLSGHIPKKNGEIWTGKLGEDVSVDEGRLAAVSVALDLLASLQQCIGNLDRVKKIVKLTCMVNSSPTFTNQHLVANGASELFNELYGSKHARSAFGVAHLPLGACLEMEMVVELTGY